MSEARLVLGLARREARERARSRSFRISTAILLLAAVGAVVLPAVFLHDAGPYRIGVVDDAPAELAVALADAAGGADIEVDAFAGRSAAEAVLADDLDVLLVDRSELVWQDEPIPELRSLATSAVTQMRLRGRAEAIGLGPQQLTELLAPVELTSTSLESGGVEAERSRGPEALIATVGMVLLFVSITVYGSYILLSVIEEKQNRVVEVLLAHIDPRDLLAGKVLGHGALGLAQIVAIAAVAAAALAVTDPIDVPSSAYGAIANAVLWYLLGFAFYSILYGALGSLASRTEDAQSAIAPLTIVLMAGYFATFSIVGNPDGLVAVVGSFLPPTAPLMMPIRTALTDVAAWEIVTAVIIQLVAIVGLVRLGGRLYRGAVLKVGPKLSIREAWRATG